MSGVQYLCTFYIDKFFFGIEVKKVQEILRYQHITPVPLAPQAIFGLINLRGQIVTAIDLRTRLSFAKLDDNKKPTNIVIRTDEGAVSLLVDEIGDVLEVNEKDFEKPPETLVGVAHDLISGVYKLKDRLLIVLEINKVMETNSHQPDMTTTIL